MNTLRGENKKGNHLPGKSLLTTWSPCNILFHPWCPNTSNHTKIHVPTHHVPQGIKMEALSRLLLTRSPVGFYWDIHPPCDFKTRPSWTKPWTFPFCPGSSNGGCEGARVQLFTMQIDHSRWWVLRGSNSSNGHSFLTKTIFL